MDINSMLNLDNYPGLLPNEIIPPYIENIRTIFEELEEDSIARKAIDTYIRLLEYYNTISSPDSPSMQYTVQYCQSLKSFLIQYVQQKYPMYNIDIEIKGRIKTPVSAVNKFKSSINEYMREGKNLDDLQIKDLFAFRIIVTIKNKNEVILDDSISIPICYDIIEQAFEYSKQYSNITPIESKPRSERNVPIIHNISVPESRPTYIIENERFIKDYIKYPKRNSNYQSAHIKLKINAPKSHISLFFEIQIRTHQMNEHAEHGPASHLAYKNRNTISYTRVPQTLEEDENGNLYFINMDKAFEEFYNFPISYIHEDLSFEFLRTFLVQTEYKVPIGLLDIVRDEDGNITFDSNNNRIIRIPVQIVSPHTLDENSNLEAIALDMFNKEKIIPELDEIGSH